jgi:hypothetical protein
MQSGTASPMRGASFGKDGFSAPLTSAAAVVHTNYDVLDPPPKPDSNWTRFICISDTHSQAFPVPGGDVLLHSGDLTNKGTLPEFRGTVEWLMSLPHKFKV